VRHAAPEISLISFELSMLPQLVRVIVQPETLLRLPHLLTPKICSDNRSHLTSTECLAAAAASICSILPPKLFEPRLLVQQTVSDQFLDLAITHVRPASPYALTNLIVGQRLV
jgi:hypothetical protein